MQWQLPFITLFYPLWLNGCKGFSLSFCTFKRMYGVLLKSSKTRFACRLLPRSVPSGAVSAQSVAAGSCERFRLCFCSLDKICLKSRSTAAAAGGCRVRSTIARSAHRFYEPVRNLSRFSDIKTRLQSCPGVEYSPCQVYPSRARGARTLARGVRVFRAGCPRARVRITPIANRGSICTRTAYSPHVD